MVTKGSRGIDENVKCTKLPVIDKKKILRMCNVQWMLYKAYLREFSLQKSFLKILFSFVSIWDDGYLPTYHGNHFMMWQTQTLCYTSKLIQSQLHFNKVEKITGRK